MKTFLLVAIAAVVTVGCSKTDDPTAPAPAPTKETKSADQSTEPLHRTPALSTTPTAGKYVAVQTLLTKNCMQCHSGGKPKAGIDLTSYDSVMKGGKEGPIVKAGDPAGSKLDMALHGKGARKMPPAGPLPDADIATIEAWIKSGAKNG